MITLESLARTFGDVLEKEEVERICKIVCESYNDGEFRRAKLYEKLIEAAVEESVYPQINGGVNEETGDTGGLELKRSTLDEMYREVYSSEELDMIWDECKSMDEDSRPIEGDRAESVVDSESA